VNDRLTWPRYALGIARAAALRSEDPYVQVGAVVLRSDHSVAGIGYNGAPSGVEIDWPDRDRRRLYVIHAEANALRWTTPDEVKGGMIISTHHPCGSCLTLIASYGIKEVHYADTLGNAYDMSELGHTGAELRINITKTREAC